MKFMKKMRWLKLESMNTKVAKRFFNQNYTSFRSHYHSLTPPTKRARNVNQIMLETCKRFNLQATIAFIVKHIIYSESRNQVTQITQQEENENITKFF